MLTWIVFNCVTIKDKIALPLYNLDKNKSLFSLCVKTKMRKLDGMDEKILISKTCESRISSKNQDCIVYGIK